MKTYSILISLGMMSALAGCLGTGGGSGSGGGGGGADFEAAYANIEGRAPTSDMPTTLAGNYKGQMKLGVNSGSTPLLGTAIDANNAEILGDVDLTVAWSDGQATNPFTGTAGNFVATEAGTSTSIALTGSLNVAPTLPGTISRVHTPAQNIGGFTIPALDTGAFSVNMTGQISNGDEAADVNLLLGGSFFGPGGDAMLGAVSGGVKGVNSTNPALFDAGLGGVFYATK